jgi:hypothetical protein
MGQLDDLVPVYDVRTTHSIPVDASADDAFDAVLRVTFTEARLMRLLYRLRGLAVRDEPIWESMQRAGFSPAGRGTLVAVGKPWAVRERLRAVEDPAVFGEPGYAVMAIGFWAADGVLSTETRVRLTDAAARRRFRAYWLVIRPFSRLVRRSWLAAARRRAEGG